MNITTESCSDEYTNRILHRAPDEQANISRGMRAAGRQKSMGLKYEPASEPLHISETLNPNQAGWRGGGRSSTCSASRICVRETHCSRCPRSNALWPRTRAEAKSSTQPGKHIRLQSFGHLYHDLYLEYNPPDRP